MEARDLMIGDWVIGSSGEPFRIGIIDPDFLHWNEVQPIPLTQEILEKNGLNKCHEEGWSLFKYKDDDNKKMALYQIYWYKEEPFLEIASYTSDFGEFGRPGIKYVHELQHALRLCGIEKTIEL